MEFEATVRDPARPRLMLFGTGDIGSRVTALISHHYPEVVLRVVGRRADATARLANLCRLSALQCGKTVSLDYETADLFDTERVAALIRSFDPDLIFTSASVQAWHEITRLPEGPRSRLSRAGYGPWLPMHLAPTFALSRAAIMAEARAGIVNAAFPDAVNPAIRATGYQNICGIGNVCNYIPGLRTIIANDLGVSVDRVIVRFIAHHFVSFSVSRAGQVHGAPYILRIEVDGQDRSDHFNGETLFRRLSQEQHRTSGKAGQLMTAASAFAVVAPLLSGASTHTHSPGVGGLVGGWPVYIRDGKMGIDLPPGTTVAQAKECNEAGQIFDGISHFGLNGAAHFTDEAVSVMSDELGYEVTSIDAEDSASRAVELARHFRKYLNDSMS